MFPHSVPEVVIVDDGHDGNAWDNLPSELPEVTRDFGSPVQPDLATESVGGDSRRGRSRQYRVRPGDERVGFEEEAPPVSPQEGQHGRSGRGPAVIAAPATTAFPPYRFRDRERAIQATPVGRRPRRGRAVAAPGSERRLRQSWRRRWRFR